VEEVLFCTSNGRSAISGGGFDDALRILPAQSAIPQSAQSATADPATTDRVAAPASK
jgi:hypothetical protein